MSEIVLNGTPAALPEGATVAALVEAHLTSTRGIAVARNDEVVPRSAWATTVVVAGDRIEILTAAQGG